MFNIKTLNKISPIGLECFDRLRYSYGDDVENPDGIMLRSASMHEMELPESVLGVARAGAGVNNIPVEAYAEKGVVVFNTPGANANGVKELVMCGLLLSSRKIVEGIEWVKSIKDEGDAVPKLVEKGKGQFVGPEIKGKTLGVISLGASGVLVSNAAVELGMKVKGYDPYISVDRAWGLSSKVTHETSLKAIYESCDYISIHVPATKETKGMINSESIAMMKHGVRILNFARGEIVNTEDILEALHTGKAACYVTDFPNAQLIGETGVIAIPHLAASTPESEDNCAKMAAVQLADYLENGNICNSVNMPDASMERSGIQRVCVIHKNTPSMISKITGTISDSGINIANLMNKSKKEMAYTIVDVDTKVDVSLAETLMKVDGILRVRVI